MNSKATHNAVQGIAPPSGKFTHLPERKENLRTEFNPVHDAAKVVEIDEESKDVINEISSMYSDSAVFQNVEVKKQREPGENDYVYMNFSMRNKPSESVPRIKTKNFVEDQDDAENPAGAAYGAFSVPSNKQ